MSSKTSKLDTSLRICFISGPYQPSKCGISDYLDLLEAEFIKRNYSTKRLWIESPKDFDLVAKDLPKADLFCVQFAPFSFSKYGLSKKPLYTFAHLLHGKKVSVNFHEIWIGAYPGASLKESFHGWLQKHEILKFLRIARPAAIHTTNSACLLRLQRVGIKAKFMYLFGNIPYIKPHTIDSHSGVLRVAFFGTLYESFPYNRLAEVLRLLSKSLAKKFELRIIGRQRTDGGLLKIKKIASDNEFLFSETKELSTHKISLEFSSSSIAVATTPYDILGKSGGTAAMLEHGLPVLVYDDEDTPKENLFVFSAFRDQVFLLNENSNIEKITQFINKPRKVFFDGVSHVADRMLEEIS